MVGVEEAMTEVVVDDEDIRALPPAGATSLALLVVMTPLLTETPPPAEMRRVAAGLGPAHSCSCHRQRARRLVAYVLETISAVTITTMYAGHATRRPSVRGAPGATTVTGTRIEEVVLVWKTGRECSIYLHQKMLVLLKHSHPLHIIRRLQQSGEEEEDEEEEREVLECTRENSQAVSKPRD